MHFLTHRTSPCFYLSCSWRNALWLNTMHCGKKCGSMQCIVGKSDEFENSSLLIYFLWILIMLLLAPFSRSAAIIHGQNLSSEHIFLLKPVCRLGFNSIRNLRVHSSNCQEWGHLITWYGPMMGFYFNSFLAGERKIWKFFFQKF